VAHTSSATKETEPNKPQHGGEANQPANQEKVQGPAVPQDATGLGASGQLATREGNRPLIDKLTKPALPQANGAASDPGDSTIAALKSIYPQPQARSEFEIALEKVKSDQRFTFDGNEYFRHGDATYRAQNSIPNVGEKLSPEEAGRIDTVRARTLMDHPGDPNPYSPIDTVSDVAAAAIVAAAGGAAAPVIASAAGSALITSLAKGLLKDSI
jgi:hypothetical protein